MLSTRNQQLITEISAVCYCARSCANIYKASYNTDFIIDGLHLLYTVVKKRNFLPETGPEFPQTYKHLKECVAVFIDICP